jgi:hypothetical protein
MTRCRRPFVIALATTCLAALALHAGVALGVFGHRCARFNANETAAVATLRNIASAQKQFREVVPDRYGTFGELSADAPIRGTDRLLSPPLLSGAFRGALSDGTVRRSGYRFRIDLEDGGWRCFAWPDPRREGSRRTFLIDGSAGVVLATVDERHEGDRGPAALDGNDWVEVR